MTLSDDDRLWRDQNFPNMSDEDFDKIIHTFSGNDNSKRSKPKKNDNNQNGKSKKIIPIKKYSKNGKGSLYESAVIGEKPTFVYLDKSQKIQLVDQIERGNDILIPDDTIDTQNPIPFVFDSKEDLEQCLEEASKETLDSLFIKVDSEFRKYVNVEEHYYPLLVGDTIWTWFQDRFGYTHYIIIVGDNGSGKNSALLLFKHLGYRVFYVTLASAANYYTKMGNVEEGQITMAEDEAEDIAENRDKRNVWKTGYCSGATVPKVELEGGRKSDDWLTYSQKWAAMEELPDHKNIKGIVDRSLVLRFVVGDVPYNIKDIIRSGGDPKYIPLYNQLIHLRRVLFCFRLLHHNDIIVDVDLNVKNRTQELTKSLIRLFQDSPIALEKILDSLSVFMVERNEVKRNSFESKLHDVISELTDERNQRFEDRKDSEEDRVLGESTFTNQIIKEKCVKLTEADEIPDKVGLFYSPELGTFSQSKISRVLKSKFKGKGESKLIEGKTYRCIKLEQKVLDRIKSLYYDIPDKIEILKSESEAHTEAQNYGITEITETRRVYPQNNDAFEGENECENNEKDDEQPPDSCNFRNSVIIPDKNTSSLYDCYECVRTKKKRFRTDSKTEYEAHVLSHNGKALCYPNKADLELHGWRAQGREWEK